MSKKIEVQRWFWCLALACVLVTPATAASEKIVGEKAAGEVASVQPACGAAERAAFLDAANNGVPAGDLVAMYAHCGGGGSESLTVVEVTAALEDREASADPVEKVITINNGLASIFYEQMNGCGYHPQMGVAACDVEIKQTFGFGPFGAPPLGSVEYVDFCFFCPGGPFPVQGTVHVTDDISGVAPSYGMVAFAAIPPACGMPAGTGAPLFIRATLSWGVPAIAPCTPAPVMVWGNQIDFDTRDDP
jgi:hypothetical protein